MHESQLEAVCRAVLANLVFCGGEMPECEIVEMCCGVWSAARRTLERIEAIYCIGDVVGVTAYGRLVGG